MRNRLRTFLIASLIALSGCGKVGSESASTPQNSKQNIDKILEEKKEISQEKKDNIFLTSGQSFSRGALKFKFDDVYNNYSLIGINNKTDESLMINLGLENISDGIILESGRRSIINLDSVKDEFGNLTPQVFSRSYNSVRMPGERGGESVFYKIPELKKAKVFSVFGQALIDNNGGKVPFTLQFNRDDWKIPAVLHSGQEFSEGLSKLNFERAFFAPILSNSGFYMDLANANMSKLLINCKADNLPIKSITLNDIVDNSGNNISKSNEDDIPKQLFGEDKSGFRQVYYLPMRGAELFNLSGHAWIDKDLRVKPFILQFRIKDIGPYFTQWSSPGSEIPLPPISFGKTNKETKEKFLFNKVYFCPLIDSEGFETDKKAFALEYTIQGVPDNSIKFSDSLRNENNNDVGNISREFGSPKFVEGKSLFYFPFDGCENIAIGRINASYTDADGGKYPFLLAFNSGNIKTAPPELNRNFTNEWLLDFGNGTFGKDLLYLNLTSSGDKVKGHTINERGLRQDIEGKVDGNWIRFKKERVGAKGHSYWTGKINQDSTKLQGGVNADEQQEAYWGDKWTGLKVADRSAQIKIYNDSAFVKDNINVYRIVENKSEQLIGTIPPFNLSGVSFEATYSVNLLDRIKIRNAETHVIYRDITVIGKKQDCSINR